MGERDTTEWLSRVTAEFIRVKVDVIFSGRNRSSTRSKAGDLGHPDRLPGGG